ncbi:MAG: DUF4139 domain-containing protein, partial [Spirochaetota bacterium]
PAAEDLPITRVALFSSGVAYFEHRGTVKGDATVSLPFATSEINDVLKSLVIWDLPGPGPIAGSPSVSYPSLQGLDEALRGLRIDLTGAPKIADILVRLRGAELTVESPEAITGRIVSVESRGSGKDGAARPTLVLLSAKGVRAVALDDIVSWKFTDDEISADFSRALSLILGARDADRRVVDVRLPGLIRREAALGYIVAAPVWKASYRLDLSGDKPWIQGWAIVDNPSEQDWKDVSLSLVSGRPVSFVQNLYAPLRLDRPLIPLSIAGTAEARVFDSGYGASADEDFAAEAAPAKSMASLGAGAPPPPAPSMAKRAEAPASQRMALSESKVETTVAKSAGDQFEFTVKKPVTLERRRSAMLPLVAASITAEKVSIWSPEGSTKNPMLGVRLTNSLGMKLPAGPITIFDGGSYAGDALIEFLPEKDRRLLVYGQDLSVTAEASKSSSQETIGVTVSKGVLIFSRRVTITRNYEFRNASSTARKILIEHPITGGSELMVPAAFDEKTGTVYRFILPLPAGGQARLEVKERSPAQERVALLGQSSDTYLYYASSSEVPATVRDALRKAVELRKLLDDSRRAVSDLTVRTTEITNDQSRIRQNLSAVGRDSSQGQSYLKRLMDSELELDTIATKTSDAKKALQAAQGALDTYIGELSLN